MTTWKDNGNYGLLCREVTDKTGNCVIARVWTKQFSLGSRNIEPYPQGEANFDLILNAPQTADALRVIAGGAIVSPEQPPEKIAEQVLRVLRLVREDCVKSLEVIGIQQKRAERAEAALEAIRDKVECYLQPLADYPSVNRARWEAVRDQAVTAIAAVKGEETKT